MSWFSGRAYSGAWGGRRASHADFVRRLGHRPEDRPGDRDGGLWMSSPAGRKNGRLEHTPAGRGHKVPVSERAGNDLGQPWERPAAFGLAWRLSRKVAAVARCASQRPSSALRSQMTKSDTKNGPHLRAAHRFFDRVERTYRYASSTRRTPRSRLSGSMGFSRISGQ